jgi:hypothetical protein
MRMIDRWWWGLGVIVCACGSPPTRAAPKVADKASLFADPTLVPTRDGEAARRELAESGEITQAIGATSWIEDTHVDVEREAGRTRVLVTGRRTAIAPADLDAHVHRIARAVCGDEMELVLTLADAAQPPPAPSRRLDLPLGLALVGLGASLAVLADRSWRRRLVARRRAGARART